MSTDLISVTRETPLDEAARLLERMHVHHLPVVNHAGALIGMVGPRELRRGAHGHVGDVIGREMILADAGDDILDVARLMIEHHVEAVPIVDDTGRAIGIVSYVDALDAMASEIERDEDPLAEVIELPV